MTAMSDFKRISSQLYIDITHFILELIQNVDNNMY